MAVENFWTKVLKGTPLRQMLIIWWNKSFGVCASSGVLTYTAARKKHARTSSHSSGTRVVYCITLRRYRAAMMVLQLVLSVKKTRRLALFIKADKS